MSQISRRLALDPRLLAAGTTPLSLLRRRAAAFLGVVGLFAGVAVVVLAGGSELGTCFVAFAALTFAAISALVLANLRHHGAQRFGPANAVTSVRAGMTAIVGGFAAEGDRLAGSEDWLAWTAAGLAVAILALDGFDGWLARRTGLASPFGARYDMEIDALLILFLAALAFQFDKAGAFVWLIGLLRYAFWMAGRHWPALAADLAPSLFRKGVCAVQIVVLCVLLAPPVVPPLSQGLALFALALLCASFGRDIVSLLARRTRAPA